MQVQLKLTSHHVVVTLANQKIMMEILDKGIVLVSALVGETTTWKPNLMTVVQESQEEHGEEKLPPPDDWPEGTT